MLDLLARVPRKSRTPSGWYKFDAICCESRGTTRKRQQRAGLLFTEDQGWAYNCVNCGFKTQYHPGQPLNRKVRQLLEWQGYSPEEIGHANLASIAQRSIYQALQEQRPRLELPVFETRQLPNDAVEIDAEQDLHLPYLLYCQQRNISHHGIYITPNSSGRDSLRIIIPFWHHGQLVGWTSRYLDSRAPKYISEQQPGYVFNIDSQLDRRQTVIVTEGPMDALAIGGVAILHNSLNSGQIATLKELNRSIIIVPDQDPAGLKISESALQQGFQISIPGWHDQVKDVSDAVARYGLLATYVSILRSATRSSIKIEMRKREIEKRSR